MKTFVTAILVIGEDTSFLARALDSLANQPIDELLIVDTSATSRQADFRVGGRFSVNLIASPNSSYAQALSIAAQNSDANAQYLWLLHDDSAALPNALTELLAIAEASPAAAIVGAKQVDYQNDRIIRQLGLTLTKRGNLFTLVTGELDQSQHDALSDVLAVGTAGALVRRSVFEQLDGFDNSVPPLAADIDFSIRARIAGHRVLVAPQARVAHQLRSMSGPKRELRRAEIQLQLSYLPIALAIGYWFFLPLTTLVRILWRLANKRPDRILGEVAAGFWGYFTIAARMRARRTLSRSARKALRSLYATKQQVRNDRMRDIEQDEVEARVEAHTQLASRDSNSANPSTAQLLLGNVSNAKSFVASGGLWFMAALLALSYSFWPRDEAITGSETLPLAQNWFDLFARAGASWQPMGHGFAAPADPFVWVLSLLGAFTFWAPSLSVAILFFIAKPLAYFAAFKAASVFTRRAWVRNVAALSYVLFGALNLAQQQLRIASVIAMVVAPFIVYTLARVGLIGAEVSIRTKAQTWTWVALSGLAIAIVTAASPNTIPVILVGLTIVLALRPRRFGYLIWVGLPMAAIFTPYVFYLVVGALHPLAIFADPGVPVSFAQPSLIEIALASALLALTLFGLLSRVWLRVLALLGFAGLSLGLGWFFMHVQFVAVGAGPTSADWVNGNPLALFGLAGLALACGLAVWLDSVLRRSFARSLGAITLAIAAASAAWFVVNSPVVHFTSARVMPALIDAQAKAGSQAQVLVISAKGSRYEAQYTTVSGVQLEDLSVAYRYSLARIEATQNRYSSVASLVAQLVTSTSPQSNLFSDNDIAYVLVPNANSESARKISAALDQVGALQSAGLTAYGKVWRVVDAHTVAAQHDDTFWSVTKSIQATVLLGFILLAIPTTGRRRAPSVAEIFIEETEGENA